MNKKTRKALEDSIAHWERMRAFNEIYEFDKEGPYDNDCSLCELFIRNHCEGCPVMERTGKEGCEGSPYSSAKNAFEMFPWTKHDRTKWRRAATREIKFLRSLR